MKSLMRMISAIATAAVSLTAAAAVSADTLTASKVFADIPLQVLELLRPSTRLDMLDYYTEADSLWKAPNAMEGYSVLQKVTDDYLSLEVSPVSTLQIKLLPYRNSRIVMTLYTVGDENTAKDTEIQFFDAALNPLESQGFFTPPTMADFFSVGKGGVAKKELDEEMPFQTIEYVTGPGDTPLTATYTTLTSLSQEAKEKLTPSMRSPLQYFWTGKKYELNKKKTR